MSEESLKSLVPEIEKWLRDHGAVFPPQMANNGMAVISWGAPATPEELAEIEKAPVAETRILVIGEPLEALTGLAPMIAAPDCWEYAMGRLIEGTSEVFVRYVRFRTQEYGDHVDMLPERIHVRLSVIPKGGRPE